MSVRRRALLTAFPLLARPRITIRGLVTRKHSIGNRDYLFVELQTSDGLTGLGEASLPGRADIVEQAVAWFRTHMLERDPAGIEEHWNRNYFQLSRWRDGPALMTALSAIDLALWDLEGKRLGEPVWRLGGASAARPMRVYYSHWSQGLASRAPEALRDLAAQARAQGWTCVKWVLPKGGSETERLARLTAEVEAVRRGGGAELDIALEMWETFTVRSALDLARAVAPFRPLFLEEPYWREVTPALAEIAAKSPVPLAGGEGLLHRFEFRPLFESRAVQIAQPDVIHCGGITELRRIAALAETYGIEISPHMWYGPVAHTASLQAMAATQNFLIQEWDAVQEDLFVTLTNGTFPRVTRGHVMLNERPGLGIEMNWAELERRFPYRGQSLRPPGGR